MIIRKTVPASGETFKIYFQVDGGCRASNVSFSTPSTWIHISKTASDNYVNAEVDSYINGLEEVREGRITAYFNGAVCSGWGVHITQYNGGYSCTCEGFPDVPSSAAIGDSGTGGVSKQILSFAPVNEECFKQTAPYIMGSASWIRDLRFETWGESSTTYLYGIVDANSNSSSRSVRIGIPVILADGTICDSKVFTLTQSAHTYVCTCDDFPDVPSSAAIGDSGTGGVSKQILSFAPVDEECFTQTTPYIMGSANWIRDLSFETWGESSTTYLYGIVDANSDSSSRSVRIGIPVKLNSGTMCDSKIFTLTQSAHTDVCACDDFPDVPSSTEIVYSGTGGVSKQILSFAPVNEECFTQTTPYIMGSASWIRDLRFDTWGESSTTYLYGIVDANSNSSSRSVRIGIPVKLNSGTMCDSKSFTLTQHGYTPPTPVCECDDFPETPQSTTGISYDGTSGESKLIFVFGHVNSDCFEKPTTGNGLSSSEGFVHDLRFDTWGETSATYLYAIVDANNSASDRTATITIPIILKDGSTTCSSRTFTLTQEGNVCNRYEIEYNSSFSCTGETVTFTPQLGNYQYSIVNDGDGSGGTVRFSLAPLLANYYTFTVYSDVEGAAVTWSNGVKGVIVNGFHKMVSNTNSNFTATLEKQGITFSNNGAQCRPNGKVEINQI